MDVMQIILEGVAAVAMMFIAVTLSDLRDRIVRIEDYLFINKKGQ